MRKRVSIYNGIQENKIVKPPPLPRWRQKSHGTICHRYQEFEIFIDDPILPDTRIYFAVIYIFLKIFIEALCTQLVVNYSADKTLWFTWSSYYLRDPMETATRPWFKNLKCFQVFGLSASHRSFLPPFTINASRLPHTPVETQKRHVSALRVTTARICKCRPETEPKYFPAPVPVR